MNAWQKLTGFIFGLVVVFAAAVGVGAILGPDGGAGTESSDTHGDMPAPAPEPAPAGHGH